MRKEKPPAPVPPGSGIPFTHDDDTHAARAREQKAYFKALADRVERGEPLGATVARQVAQVLRLHADQIPAEQPRKRGRPPMKADAGSLAMEFAFMTVHKGMDVTAAHDALAERQDMTVEGVKKALAKYQDEAIRQAAAAVSIERKPKR
jgi:hypothetical protein